MGKDTRYFKTTKEAFIWKLVAWAAISQDEQTLGADSSEADKAWQQARSALAALDDLQMSVVGQHIGEVWTLPEGWEVHVSDSPGAIVAGMRKQAAPGMSEALSVESMVAGDQPAGNSNAHENKWRRGLKVRVLDWELVAKTLLRLEMGGIIDSTEGLALESMPHVWTQPPDQEQEGEKPTSAQEAYKMPPPGSPAYESDQGDCPMSPERAAHYSSLIDLGGGQEGQPQAAPSQGGADAEELEHLPLAQKSPAQQEEHDKQARRELQGEGEEEETAQWEQEGARPADPQWEQEGACSYEE